VRDFDPLAVNAKEKLFYRLKIVDQDGSFTYSSIAVVNPIHSKTSSVLYPNPAKGGEVYIKLSKTTYERVSIRIEDMSGKTYKVFSVVPNNSGLVHLNIADLPAGIYMLKIISTNETEVKQLFITR
jgi:hypothetical protein